MSIFWDFLVCIFFPAFRLNISPYSVGMREKTDQKNSKYGHFSRSVNIDILCFCYVSISFRWLFTCWTLCWSEAALHRCYIKSCSENMQQSYRRTPILKCDFNKFAKQLYWNHLSVLVFSCKFTVYFQSKFS